MKENIEEIIREYGDKEARASLMFFLCFNLLNEDNNYTSGELRKIVYDVLDALGIEE